MLALLDEEGVAVRARRGLRHEPVLPHLLRHLQRRAGGRLQPHPALLRATPVRSNLSSRGLSPGSSAHRAPEQAAGSDPDNKCRDDKECSSSSRSRSRPVLVAGVSLASRWWGPTDRRHSDRACPGSPGRCCSFSSTTRASISVSAPASGSSWASRASALSFWPTASIARICALAAVALASGVGCLFRERVGGAVHGLRKYCRMPSTCSFSPRPGIGVGGLLATLLLLPRPGSPPALQSLPWWDIPMRMGAPPAHSSRSSCCRRRAGAAAVRHHVHLSRDRHRGRRVHPQQLGPRGRVAHAARRHCLAVLVRRVLPVVGLLLPSCRPRLVLCRSPPLVAVAMTTGLFFLNRARVDAIGLRYRFCQVEV